MIYITKSCSIRYIPLKVVTSPACEDMENAHSCTGGIYPLIHYYLLYIHQDYVNLLGKDLATLCQFPRKSNCFLCDG